MSTDLFTTHLARTNWTIRYAYFGSDWIPRQTNLCILFWRCVFRTCIYGVLLALLGHVLIAIYVWTDIFWTVVALFVGMTLLAALLYGGWRALVFGSQKTLDAFNTPTFNPVMEYARAVKSKICPLIHIEY